MTLDKRDMSEYALILLEHAIAHLCRAGAFKSMDAITVLAEAHTATASERSRL